MKKKRNAVGLSQYQLAEMLGYSPQFIANWERGVSNPPAKALPELIQALEIPEKEMLDLLIEQSAAYWQNVIAPRTRKRLKRKTALRATASYSSRK